MAATYRIFGINVGYSTFQKYNHQNYVLGHIYCGLSSIERWATDPDLAAQFPDMAAEAKQLMKSIIKEITGKEDENMKDPKTAADFITALQEIYTSTRAVYTAYQGEIDKLERKFEKLDKERTAHDGPDKMLANARYEVAKGNLALAKAEFFKTYKKMIDSHDQKVKALREQFHVFLDEHYAASPDKLDTATMQLLGSGICTPVELARLVDRHQGNPTMLRIVGEYARKLREDNWRNMSPDNRVICSNVATACFSAKDGSREMRIFDEAVTAAAYGLDKDAAHAARMDKHVVGWFDTFREQMNNLPNTPEHDEAE